MAFQKAEKSKSKLRLSIAGPAKSGKTYSALAIGKHLGNRMAVIDTERGSASLYADEFEFDVKELERFSPEDYIAAIREAEQAGYDVLIIDSISHEWEGTGGCQELADLEVKKNRNLNNYTKWAAIFPRHVKFIEAILHSPCHIIVTMRSKMDYKLTEGENGGKGKVQKVGMAPIQRPGAEYEFTFLCEMDMDHSLIVFAGRSGGKCPELDSQLFPKPGKEFAEVLLRWLNSGKDKPATPTTTSPKAHWTSKPELVQAVRAHRERLGLTSQQVLEIAGIKRMTDCAIDPSALMKLMDAWVAKNQPPVQGKTDPVGAGPQPTDPIGEAGAIQLTAILDTSLLGVGITSGPVRQQIITDYLGKALDGEDPSTGMNWQQFASFTDPQDPHLQLFEDAVAYLQQKNLEIPAKLAEAMAEVNF